VGNPSVTLARPYARAAFALARDSDSLPQWSMRLGFAAQIALALDDTDRRVREQAVRLSERNYRSLVEEVPYGICRCTSDDQLLQVNRAIIEMLGWESEADVMVRSLRHEIFEEAEACSQFLDRLRASIARMKACQQEPGPDDGA
jgi:PAS domain-containing protein